MPLLRTFEANTTGRDFVIGDLHGSWECFENLLKNLNFDKTKDRMFSVGDLVDRGPHSLKCLELLYEPWFFAVLANHEQMMVEAFRGGYMGQFWLRNGGLWGATALQVYKDRQRTFYSELDAPRIPTDDEALLIDLIDKVEDLPVIMTVKLRDGRQVHILHAELPPGVTITDEDLQNEEKILELATVQSSDGDFFVWGRHRFYNYYRADLQNVDKIKRAVAYEVSRFPLTEGLSHVISGHTIVQKPLTLLGFTNIDTGAYGSYPNSYGSAAKWCSLTCLELNSWSFYQATPTEFRSVEPVVVNRADVEQIRSSKP